MQADADYRHTGALRHHQHAWRITMCGTLGSVRGNRNLAALLQHPYHFEQGATTAARGGSPHRAEAERQCGARHYLAIAMFADEHLRALVTVLPEQRKELTMPESEDQWLTFSACVARSLVTHYPNAPGACEELHDHNPGTNGPAKPAITPAGLLPASGGHLGGRPLVHVSYMPSAISATRCAAPGVPRRDRTSASPPSISRRSSDSSRKSGSRARATFAGTRSFCTNSRASSLPATMFTRPMCGIFTTRRAML